jgi:hypothetical protein
MCVHARKGHHRSHLSHPMMMVMATAMVTMMATVVPR